LKLPPKKIFSKKMKVFLRAGVFTGRDGMGKYGETLDKYSKN
jgi:hypothetical protein